jgi:hypothetical protein
MISLDEKKQFDKIIDIIKYIMNNEDTDVINYRTEMNDLNWPLYVVLFIIIYNMILIDVEPMVHMYRNLVEFGNTYKYYTKYTLDKNIINKEPIIICSNFIDISNGEIIYNKNAKCKYLLFNTLVKQFTYEHKKLDEVNTYHDGNTVYKITGQD